MAKGFWGVLEKVGLVEQVEVEEAAPAANADSHTTVLRPLKTSAAVDPAVQSRNAELDTSARQQLAQAMERAGAKLVEDLGDLLETLAAAIADEKTRYTTAINILLKQGHNVAAICADMDKCIGVLEEKDREFQAQLKSQFDKRVGSKTSAVAQCTEQIQAKTLQIQKIQREIAELAQQATEAQSGIGEEQTKLTQVQERFGLVYRAIRGEVESQRAKVVQYGDPV